MSDSIFTKIIKGEIPCHKVYEDDQTLVFMDIHPIQPGHVLVVLKEQIPSLLELDDDQAAAFWSTIRKVAARLHTVFPEKKRIGVMIEGLDVDHVHAKLFPIDSGSEYRNEPDMTIEPDHIVLAAMAAKIAF